MPDKIIYDAYECQTDMVKLCRQVTLEGKPDVILGIARGGLVPAVQLSHYFNVPLVTARISLRDANHIEDLSNVAELVKAGKRVLLVDDICDSGATLKVIRDILLALVDEETLDANFKSLVLWNNPSQDAFTADYFARTIDRKEDESWIIFPWENWWEL